MKLTVNAEIDYVADPGTAIFLRVHAEDGGAQTVLSEQMTAGGEPVDAEPAAFSGRLARICAPGGPIRIEYRAEVHVSDGVEHPRDDRSGPLDLPAGVLPFLLPSRYCPSDRTGDFARDLAAGAETALEKAEAIAGWIGANVRYAPGSTNARTWALDTLVDRRGVCRDFAHLGVTLCRSLGVPARYVSIYGLDVKPMDFHAVFDAWIGGRWVMFDPTGLSRPDATVRIGAGRDAADVAFAETFGPARLQALKVSVGEDA